MNLKRQAEIKVMLCSCDDCKDEDVYFKELQQLGKNLEFENDFKQIFTFLNALGNKERLKLIEILKVRDRCVCELEAALNKSQSSISHHLRILESAGLIRGWKKGKFTYYGIQKKEINEYLALAAKEFKFED